MVRSVVTEAVVVLVGDSGDARRGGHPAPGSGNGAAWKDEHVVALVQSARVELLGEDG